MTAYSVWHRPPVGTTWSRVLDADDAEDAARQLGLAMWGRGGWWVALPAGLTPADAPAHTPVLRYRPGLSLTNHTMADAAAPTRGVLA